MPKVARIMTDAEVSFLSDSGCYAVGGVAGLNIQVGTSKSWILRIVIGGKRHEIGLGGYPSVSLDDARSQARFIRSEVNKGVNWLFKKREAAADILKEQKIEDAISGLRLKYESMLREVLRRLDTNDAKLLALNALGTISASEERMSDREALNEKYVRSLLVDSGFPKGNIPSGLIDLKREQLKIKRFLIGA